MASWSVYNFPMKKPIIVLLLVALAAGVLYLTWGSRDGSVKSEDSANKISATYSDGVTSVEATFDNAAETVTFSHPALGSVTLPRAVSGSGARYASSDEGVVFWEHQGELTITKDDKVIFKGGQPTESASLSGNGWVWVETDLQSGEKVVAPAGERFVLSFDAEVKRLSSTTDCNQLSGTYVQDGEVLSVGPLVSTKMYCEGSVESVYSGQLALVSSFVIEGDTLRLNLNRDYGVMVYKKK